MHSFIQLWNLKFVGLLCEGWNIDWERTELENWNGVIYVNLSGYELCLSLIPESLLAHGCACFGGDLLVIHLSSLLWNGIPIILTAPLLLTHSL